ncbi:MAG: c-type cytochrome [Burkholderiales bacterium]
MRQIQIAGLFRKLWWLGLIVFGLLAAVPASAQHKSHPNDMEVPTHDMTIVTEGKGLVAQRCAFCHGGDAAGGKGPCLTCAKFAYTGNSNSDIYTTIAVGVPKSLGGSMGAFGTTMSQEQIVAVITFLRWEEKRRISTGEIRDPSKDEKNKQVEFPGDKKY